MTYDQAMRRMRWNDDYKARRQGWDPCFYVDIRRNFTPDGRGLTKPGPTLCEIYERGTLYDPYVPAAEDLAATDWEVLDEHDINHRARARLASGKESEPPAEPVV